MSGVLAWIDDPHDAAKAAAAGARMAEWRVASAHLPPRPLVEILGPVLAEGREMLVSFEGRADRRFIGTAIGAHGLGAAWICVDHADFGPSKDAPRLIARFTDLREALAMLPSLRIGGRGGAMLSLGSEARHLLESQQRTLSAFVSQCQGMGLQSVVRGCFEEPDLPRLKRLGVDLVAFEDPHGPPDAACIARRVRLLAAPEPAEAVAERQEHDLVFIRDFVQDMAVGAYGHERGRNQSVRFTLEARVASRAWTGSSMAEVYSYDLMMDAVREIAGRPHADFVEDVAEELAAMILCDPRVVEVLVRVEKLDLGPGAAGIEIRRQRR